MCQFVGHHGEKTTIKNLNKNFYWPKMKKNMKHYVHTCVKCQNTKLEYKKKFKLYKPLLNLANPF